MQILLFLPNRGKTVLFVRLCYRSLIVGFSVASSGDLSFG